MSRLDDADLSAERSGSEDFVLEGAELPLVDLPLGTDARPGAAHAFQDVSMENAVSLEKKEETSREGGAAPLSARWMAFAADAAVILLAVAASLLAATAGRFEAPSRAGLAWALLFAVYLSFFATSLALTLFGKTVGMALTGLSARSEVSVRLTAGESARRWLGTVLTAAALGLPLLFTGRRRDAPTPADRLSGRPLVLEG